VATLVLSALMFVSALRVLVAADSYTLLMRAKTLFRDSLFYLGGLFGALFVERMVGIPALLTSPLTFNFG